MGISSSSRPRRRSNGGRGEVAHDPDISEVRQGEGATEALQKLPKAVMASIVLSILIKYLTSRDRSDEDDISVLDWVKNRP